MTVTNHEVDADGHHAWDPGIRSKPPREAQRLATIFRPENMLTTLEQVEERAAFTGLDIDELVVFRPERLALHSLLIRVTANVSISDGTSYQDLGINFRQIAKQLEQSYLGPLLPRIGEDYEELRDKVAAFIEPRLVAAMQPPAPPPDAPVATGLRRFMPFGRSSAPRPAAPKPQELHEAECRAAWEAEAAKTGDEVLERSLRSLCKLANAITIKQGRLRGDLAALVEIAVGMTMNVVGSERIGMIVEEGFAAAVTAAGHRLLPAQAKPVVMNVKGASAAGKSTMRPLQHELAKELGVDWRDFALISPDIWRKYLIDYGGLGASWRYAGMLSGQELEFVDHKLDLYMTYKGRNASIPHMLIDRFRFDSFAEVNDNKGEGRLLTRFGDQIFMAFMVTPPEELVRRAWIRGCRVQRFKAVDDLLDHNVEAYSGMPPLFFRWATRSDKRVHYEFLDNSVGVDERPATIAFGSGGELVILQVKGLLDIERFRKINIQARSPEEIYPDAAADHPESHTALLEQCAQRLRRLRFADAGTGKVYARFENGSLRCTDKALLDRACGDPATAAGLRALTREPLESLAADDGENETVPSAGTFTLGYWSDRPRWRSGSGTAD